MDKTQEKELKLLVDFLNFDSKQKAETDRDRSKALLTRVTSIIGPTSERDWSDMATILQAQVRKELKNLIGPDTNESAFHNDLKKLVGKINGLGLTPTWSVSSTKRAIAALKIGRRSWALTPQFANLKNPTEKLYSLIFTACMDGSISQLKECKNCNRVFILKAGNRKFCKAACTAAFYAAGALKRQREHRQRQRKEKSRLEKQPSGQAQIAGREHRKQTKDDVRERAGIKAFEEFLAKSEEKHPERDDGWLSHFNKILGASNPARWRVIRQWLSSKNSGESIEAIWLQLPKAFRDSLLPKEFDDTTRVR